MRNLSEMVAFLRENPEASWNPLYDAIEELANETRQEPFTNSIGMEFVWIPPGRFMMGAPDSDDEANTIERPQHEVVLTREFYFGKYPVTRGQFSQFVKSMDFKTAHDWQNPGFEQSADHPVVNVDWNDAAAFCRWISEQERDNYRLPTEAEWEYACRAGTTTPRYGPITEIAWHDTNSGNTTRPAGRLQPNAWGLYDMLGNAGQWCSDNWRDYPASKCIDPAELDFPPNRVFRGGDWADEARYLRSSCRAWNHADGNSAGLGFRVVCSFGWIDQRLLESQS